MKKQGLQTAGWLVVLVWGLANARAFFIPVCIAGLLAFLLSPFVKALRRRNVPEWISLTLAVLGMLLPFAVVVYALVMQGQKLVHDFPVILASFERTIAQLTDQPWVKNLGISLPAMDMHSLTSRLGSGAGKGLAVIVGGLSVLLDASTQTALVLIFTILMVASRSHLRESAERILAQIEGFHATAVLDEVTSLIQRFLVVRLLIVAIIGAADAITLQAFGIEYGLLLGALVGVMTLVPNIGFILALIPILIVALATGHSPGAIIGLTAVLIAISFVEGNVLSPKWVGQRLNINTLTSFIGFFAGGLLWGVWGMLLSVPFLGVLRIVFSALPELQPWGDLLADKKEDHRLTTTRPARKNQHVA